MPLPYTSVRNGWNENKEVPKVPMKKLKICLFVTGALALALLCAGLPAFAAMLMDRQVEKTPDYNTVRPVTLETQEELSVLAKLSLYINGSRVSVKAERATKTPDEIRACVEQFLSQCQARGIYQGMNLSGMTVTPNMVYNANDPTECIIVWRCYATQNGPGQNASGQEELRRLTDVAVDDETGKILSASFDHTYVTYSQADIWERNRNRVEPLAQLYFAQLGLTEKAETAKASPEKYYDYLEIDMGVTEVYYTFLDPDCGAVRVSFLVGGVDTFRITVAG